MNKAQWTRRLFRVGVLLKGIDGMLEVLGGLLLLVATSGSIHSIVWTLTEHEISEDPTDTIAGLLRHVVVSLLRELKWAFPVALGFLGAFTAYQLYRFAHTHSIALLVFSVVDLFIMGMVWREYAVRRNTGAFGSRVPRTPQS